MINHYVSAHFSWFGVEQQMEKKTTEKINIASDNEESSKKSSQATAEDSLPSVSCKCNKIWMFVLLSFWTEFIWAKLHDGKARMSVPLCK